MNSKVQLIDFLSPLRHLKLPGGVFFIAFQVNALLLLVNVKIPFICLILTSLTEYTVISYLPKPDGKKKSNTNEKQEGVP